MKAESLIGKTFGRLTILGEADKSGYSRCLCECGEIKDILTKSVTLGYTKSCGCYMLERTSEVNRTHGESRTRLYKTWNSMLSRCEIPTQTSYKHYGGRGISVCEEWHNYEIFRDWAMKHGYTEGLTLERICVDGNYCPENCRWATHKEQANNRKNNRLITLLGVTHTLAEWSDITGVNPSTISWRIKHGKSDEDVLKKVNSK